MSSAGASAGALLGGILTDFLSWRWILFVNVPVGIVAVVAAIRYLPESRADLEHRHLDLAGAVTVTAGLVALVYALVRTETYSWGSSEVLLPLALGVCSWSSSWCCRPGSPRRRWCRSGSFVRARSRAATSSCS